MNSLLTISQTVRNIFEKAEREQAAKERAEKGAEEETKRLETKERKEEELKKGGSGIYEVTDEEAAKLQEEIDEEKCV